jgi:hypothetical protein
MTRRSKRELERIVDDLAGDGDDVDAGGAGIVYATNDGGYVDGGGRAVDDLEDVRADDGGPVIVLQAEYADDPPAGVAGE